MRLDTNSPAFFKWMTWSCMSAQEQNFRVFLISLQFPNHFVMKLELDKCRKVHFIRGEVDMQLGHQDQASVKTITEKASFKYSGVLQLWGPLQNTMKESLLQSFSKRLSSILRTSLHLTNKIKAINFLWSGGKISSRTDSWSKINWTWMKRLSTCVP